MFSVFENDGVPGEEYLSDKNQTNHITKIFNKFYGIQSEAILNSDNLYLEQTRRAQANRANSNKSSLTTVAACSQVVNQVLIGQHQPWVLKLHNQYLKQTKQEVNKETVFDRIHQDELYRE